MKEFDAFKKVLDEMSVYRLAAARIYWDMETKHTPKNAIMKHVNAYTFLNMKLFAMSTSDEYGEMLEKLSEPERFAQLDEGWQLTVTRRLKQYRKFKLMPPEFYEKMTRDRSMAGRIWTKAKQENDYASFAPILKCVIDNAKQQVAYTDPGKDVYDVLLNDHEEGMGREETDRVFGELLEGLRDILPAILAQKQPDPRPFEMKYDIDHQKAAARYLLNYIGYDMDSGDMDEVEHPVTMGTGRTDVRVTDHYYEDDGIGPLLSIIHEGGHGIGGQKVSPELEGTDAEGTAHKGLAESQSRFYENMLGRNINFWKPIYADIQQLMPELKGITLDQFYRRINCVQAGPIRIKADEVTYCMHIILRYELEKKLFEDDVDVNELPRMWDDRMEEYLGIRPANDREGILQDMHWSSSYLGYFPSYLLGSVYDAMYLEALERDLGSVDELLAKGEIGRITQWLSDNIFRYGSLYTTPEVVKRVCRKEVSAQPLLNYFRKKYSAIYDISL